MRPIRSLRLRFLLAFALFGALLTYIYGGLAWTAVHMAEDAMIERWLDAEMQHVLGLRAQAPDAPLPSGRLISCTTSLEQLHPDLQGRVAALSEGAHEVEGLGEARWNLRIFPLPDGQRAYLYVNESDFEASEAFDGQIDLLIFGLSTLVALIGVTLGVLTTRHIIAPLRRLTEAVAAHTPDDPPPSLRVLVSDDELGLLADHLEIAMGRVAASARQEQLFGRYTSHELRSALAVACGVSELLGDLGEQRLERPLGRLDRALQDMNGIIETCLWLARSQGRMPPSETVALRPLVDELVERLHHRASPKVALSVQVPPEAVVEAPRLALRMMLNNLLSNALRHTAEGHITLEYDINGLQIRDTGPGIPEDILTRITEPYVRGPGDGHGLGLAIVNGLCLRLGWSFHVESKVGQGTTARIRLSDMPKMLGDG
ncbi:MAG: sensor histidine kinase [Bradymonadia bacterium]